ncbi:MAG: hypothetical protein ACRENA_12175 [Vulcanimicrobiaceae bacterium]
MMPLRWPVAAAALVLAAVLVPQLIVAAGRNPFLVVDGDGWLASNANHDTGRWTVLNSSRPAFGLQLSERNDLPFDRGTAGATFWVRNANCGVAFAAFSEACGWQLGLAVTQYRSIVVGGHGIEIDGLDGKAPYGRVVNSQLGSSRVVGLLTNAFVDFSGVDSKSDPTWFAGFDLARDGFVVRRRAPNATGFDDLLSVDRDGNLAVRRSEQQASNQWATRARLLRGRYTFTYATPFEQTPVCVATSEGSAPLRVTPTTQACTVISHDPTDASTIDVMVIGNPR